MSYLNFRRAQAAGPEAGARIAAFLAGYSIEVMPRTLDAIPDLRALLPAGTRVYIAQVGDTPITDMVIAAARLRREGFEPMPISLPASSGTAPCWPTGSRATRARPGCARRC